MWLLFLVIIILLAVCLFRGSIPGNPFESKQNRSSSDVIQVKKVIDGDTIDLSDGRRIRYIGINTPEIHHPRKGPEYFGKEAREFNQNLVLGKNVRLEFDEERYDRYGRTLAYVYLEDGTFVNAELMRLGYARVMKIKPNTKYAELFKRLESEAKVKRLGLWEE